MAFGANQLRTIWSDTSYRRSVVAIAVSVCCLLPDGRARAAVSLEDLRIVGRVVTFQTQRPSGPLRLAIVYDADSAKSRDAAHSIARSMTPELIVDNLRLQPILIEQSRLAEADVGAVLSLEGVDDRVLGSAMDRLRIPCLTTDLAQVRSGACTVGIRSGPRVEIVINTQNARSNRVRFATAFLMMAREI